MRVVYMGTPAFAVPALRGLVEAGYPVVGVVTQPDRPRGRKRTRVPSPVKQYSLDRGLEVWQPLKLTDPSFIGLLRNIAPDVIVVVAYGRILPPAVLQIPRLGCINVHASLLPRYRGAAPIHWAIINGEAETGVTTMLMDEGLDTGPVLLQQSIPIGPDDNMGLVHDRLARLGATVLVETLDRLGGGRLKARPQEEALATYAPPIRREHELVVWARTAVEIKNQVRGLDPWPGAFTLLDGREMKLWRAEVVDRTDGSGKPGQVLSADPTQGLVVGTGRGALRICELQPAGGRRMPAADFLRGHPLPEGIVFGK